jgi:hypothetical protein
MYQRDGVFSVKLVIRVCGHEPRNKKEFTNAGGYFNE